MPSGGSDRIGDLCRSVLEDLADTGLTGVTLTRVATEGSTSVLYCSDALGRSLLEIHQVIAEGPHTAVLRVRGPFLLSDLLDNHLPTSWQPYLREATAAGARSLLTFPVQIGAVALGVLSIHGTQRAHVPQERLGPVVRNVERIALALLAPPPGTSSAQWAVGLLDEPHSVIHQAAGMVMVQLDSSIGDALVALRARAFSDGISPVVIARQIVNRKLRLTMNDRANPGETGRANEQKGPEDG